MMQDQTHSTIPSIDCWPLFVFRHNIHPACLWLLSWHDSQLSCWVSEGLSTSFFWWRSLSEIKMSR